MMIQSIDSLASVAKAALSSNVLLTCAFLVPDMSSQGCGEIHKRDAEMLPSGFVVPEPALVKSSAR